MAVGNAGSGALEHNVTLAETTALTQHQLVFHHRPLGEGADELNRYNVARIEIRSPSLREQEMTGTAFYVSQDTPDLTVWYRDPRNFMLRVDAKY